MFEKLIRIEVPHNIQRRLNLCLTILMLLMMLYAAYVFLYLQVSIITIYAFLIVIGLLAFVLELRISYILYGIHVFLLPCSSLYYLGSLQITESWQAYLVFVGEIVTPVSILYLHSKTRKGSVFGRFTKRITPSIFAVFLTFLLIFLPNPSGTS